MSETSSSSSSVLWVGKPWILPAAVLRTILIFIVAVLILVIEFVFGVAGQPILGVSLVLWTGLLFFVIWLVAIVNLLILQATHTYTLRNDSLEIKTGIATTNSFIVVPAGFANMEVVRSLSGRIMDMGTIVIHTQEAKDGPKFLMMIKEPEKVGAQIRDIMGKPLVRIAKD